MYKGFILSPEKCVACNACTAGCILENGWNIHLRNVYTYNPDVMPSLPVIHLSMACNHCEEPLCLKGCPSGALERDTETRAIIINDLKCLGCNYCKWNCPYDAPKNDILNGIVVKCNLCNALLKKGGEPACTSACPTGALRYGYTIVSLPGMPSLLPDKNLRPAIEISESPGRAPVKIIPERIQNSQNTSKSMKEQLMKDDWSLISFTFLISLSVALATSSFVKGVFPDETLIIILIISSLLSLFHLGRPLRAWRSVCNLKTSPLSREISLFILFFLLTSASILLKSALLLIVASISGLVLLIAIDHVYIFSDNRKSQFFHSGKTFFTGLLLISLFSEMTVSFVFIASFKLVLSAVKLISNKNYNIFFPLRFFNISVLILLIISSISGFYYADPILVFLVLAGELAGRIIYYHDFNPINISDSVRTFYK